MEQTYPTQEEAEIHGVTYGQRIIDGKVPGVSLGNENERLLTSSKTTTTSTSSLPGVKTLPLPTALILDS